MLAAEDVEVDLFIEDEEPETEALSWSLEDFPRVRMLGVFFEDLTPPPPPPFEGMVKVLVEVAAEGVIYGDEGIREISCLRAELRSSSGTLLRLLLDEAIVLRPISIARDRKKYAGAAVWEDQWLGLGFKYELPEPR